MSTTTDLLAALAARGLDACVVGTGGNCRAVEVVGTDGRHALVTDGDAGLPRRGAPVLAFLYDDDDADEGTLIHSADVCDVETVADAVAEALADGER